MSRYQHQEWPKWCAGPDGEKRIFRDPQDVPAGWSYSTKADGLVTVAGWDNPVPVPAATDAGGPTPPAPTVSLAETPKQRGARKAREARAAKKAAQA